MNLHDSYWSQGRDSCVEKLANEACRNTLNSFKPSLWKNLDIGDVYFEKDDNGNLRFRWSHERTKKVEIKKVIFSSPATIVFWSDGDKTVVKATKEPFDREKGLAMAIAKKFLGNKGNYYNTFKKHIK